MTRTGLADAAMPAPSRAAPGRTLLARPGSHELPSARPASRVPVFVRAPFPGSASFKLPRPASIKPASGRLAGRSRRPWQACPPLPRQRRARAPHPPGPWSPAGPLCSHLLKGRAASLSGCSVDPGRDALCILTSPPRWLQWP